MRLKIEYTNEIPINAFQWTPKSSKQPLHKHNSLEIGYCLSGKGFFYFEQKCFPVSVGDLFIVNHTEMHIAQSDEEDPSTYIFINFDPSVLFLEDEKLLFPFAYKSEKFQNHIPAEMPLARLLAPRVQSIYDELTGRDVGYLIRARSILLEMSVLLLRNYINSISNHSWNRMNKSNRELSQLLSFVHSNYFVHIDLSDVAAVIGWSVTRTSCFFRECMGKSLRDYVVQLRLSEARKRLVSTSDGIATICFDSGFQSMASFYRAFHSSVGMSPQEYRKKFTFGDYFENLTEVSEKS